MTFDTYPKEAEVRVGSGSLEGSDPVGTSNRPVDLSKHYDKSVLKLLITADGRKPWEKTFTTGELKEGLYTERIYLHPKNPLLYFIDFPLAFPRSFSVTFIVLFGVGFYFYREESAKRRKRINERLLSNLGKQYEIDYGDYTLIRDLGQGAMGMVRLALRKGSRTADGLVAVKTMLLKRSHLPNDSETDEDDISRMRREAKILMASNHPNIVLVYDWGEREGEYYIVMEYLKGQDLGSYLEQEAPLSLDEVRDIFSQVAAALEYLHQRSVYHRDLKPANIKRLDSGHIKVLDFGLATSSDQSRNLTKEGAVIGTLDYMSPENFTGFKQDALHDQFSLGVILFELLTGRLPVDDLGPNAGLNQIYSTYTSPRHPLQKYRPELGAELCGVIDRMLEINPNKRFESIKSAHEAFEAAYLSFRSAEH